MKIFIVVQIIFDIGASLLIGVLFIVVKELVKNIPDLGQNFYSGMPKI